MRRSIIDLIEVMISLVPDDFENKKDLVSDLKKIQRTSVYTPPEYMHQRWEQVANALQYYLAMPADDWKLEIAMIFSDDIDYQKYIKEIV